MNVFQHAACFCVLVGVGSVALGQGTFTRLQTTTGFGEVYPAAVSGNGQYVVGRHSPLGVSDRAFRWSASGGMELLGTIAPPLPGFTSRAGGVDRTGNVVVGGSADSVGNGSFRWTPSTGMRSLGIFTAPFGVSSEAVTCNDPGDVVIGVGNGSGGGDGSRAYRWTLGGGFQDLGTLPGGSFSIPIDTDASGSVVLGNSGLINAQRPFLWSASGGMQNLGVLPGGRNAYAMGISDDGLTVVGQSDSSQGFRGFVWTAAGGMQVPASLPGTISSGISCISGDGLTMAGYTVTGSGVPRPTIWLPQQGPRDFASYLQSRGISLVGWNIGDMRITGISDDGSVLVGTGRFTNAQGSGPAGWVYVVPAPAPVASMVAAGLLVARRRRGRC